MNTAFITENTYVISQFITTTAHLVKKDYYYYFYYYYPPVILAYASAPTPPVHDRLFKLLLTPGEMDIRKFKISISSIFPNHKQISFLNPGWHKTKVDRKCVSEMHNYSH